MQQGAQAGGRAGGQTDASVSSAMQEGDTRASQQPRHSTHPACQRPAPLLELGHALCQQALLCRAERAVGLVLARRTEAVQVRIHLAWARSARELSMVCRPRSGHPELQAQCVQRTPTQQGGLPAGGGSSPQRLCRALTLVLRSRQALSLASDQLSTAALVHVSCRAILSGPRRAHRHLRPRTSPRKLCSLQTAVNHSILSPTRSAAHCVSTAPADLLSSGRKMPRSEGDPCASLSHLTCARMRRCLNLPELHLDAQPSKTCASADEQKRERQEVIARCRHAFGQLQAALV